MKKRLIAVILVVAALSTMLGISGSAAENTWYNMYSYTYSNSSGINLLSLNLYEYYRTSPTEMYSVKGRIRIWSNEAYSLYDFGVVSASFTGYVGGNHLIQWRDDYDLKYYMYNVRRFNNEDSVAVDGVGIENYTFTAYSNVVPNYSYLFYVAGKSSSVQSSTFYCRYTYYDESTGFPSDIWFSDVASNMEQIPWHF